MLNEGREQIYENKRKEGARYKREQKSGEETKQQVHQKDKTTKIMLPNTNHEHFKSFLDHVDITQINVLDILNL